MKAMLFSDLITMRRTLTQLFATCFICGLVISFSIGTIAAAGGCFAAAIPMASMISVASYDEANNWQCYRFTLPMTRRDVVVGRYLALVVTMVACVVFGAIACYLIVGIASLVDAKEGFLAALAFGETTHEEIWASLGLGSFVVLIVLAVTLPLIMRMGLTRGTRILPIVVMFLAVGGFALFKENGPLGPLAAQLDTTWLSTPAGVLSASAGLIGVALVALVVSMIVAIRLYEKRDL